MPSPTDPSRRGLLVGAAGASLALTAAAAPAMNEVDAYLALRFAGRDRPGWWINRATIFAMPLGRRAVPLFDVIGLGRDRYEALPGGDYHLIFDECGWYCAPGTTTPLTTMPSPINGRTITVQHYRSPNDTFLRDGRQLPGKPPPPGAEIDFVRSPLQADADRVWMSDDIFVRSPRKAAPAALAANPSAAWNVQTSLATYAALGRDLAQHRRRWVPAICAYQTLASWRSWFDADEVPGAMSWRMHGTKTARTADIPAPLAALVRAEHPALLEA